MINIKSKIIASQFKKPFGILGKHISKLMEKYNAILYDEILDTIKSINSNENILEIGYGPGIGLNKILKHNEKIYLDGIDFSRMMYKKASRLNKEFIKDNRLKLIYSDIEKYDFKNKKYKVIIGINIIYFWNSLEEIFKKIYKLLDMNSLLILFFLKPEDLIKMKHTQTDIFIKYYKDEVLEKLKKIGFKEFKIKIKTRNERSGYYIFAYN